MLDQLFPRVHRRYRSLSILGPILGHFAAWLSQQGFSRIRICQKIRPMQRIERELRRRGLRRLSDITREQLRACAPASSRDDPDLVGTVRALGRYLDEQSLLPAPDPPSQIERLVTSYVAYLREVRGLASSTLSQHRWTAGRFLEHVGYEKDPSRLPALAATDVETFIQSSGARFGRATLQHVVAHLRSLLRFLAGRGEVEPGLETQIDTPRVYRGEQLPRSLPWETVRALLASIDRESKCGMRDYAMFLLIATYGLRCSEIVRLTLDDVHWRAGRIRVLQSKTRAPLLLPLTDEVGACLIRYLRCARPSRPYRELFLRAQAPGGVLKPTAVTEAFQAWARRSGLNIPFQGAHCLRHSYAVRLLRQGTSLKTIGDLLGHRTAESTFVYLRLAIEDLRGVALSLPKALAPDGVRESRP